jgi:signal transduction histidine kinase
VSVSTIALPADSRVQTRVLEVTGLLALGTVASVLTVGFLMHSPVLVSPTTTAVVRGLYVAAYVGAGAYTWWRRPTSLTGPMIAGVGLIFALTTLNGSGDPAAHTIGMTIWAGLLVFLAYVYLAFPRSRLGSPVERSLVVGYAAFATVTWGAILVFSDKVPVGAAFTDCGDRCPHNPFQVIDAADVVAAGLRAIYTSGSIAVIVAIGVFIVRKIRSPNRLRRRAVEPLGVAYLFTIVAAVLFMLFAPVFPDVKPTLRALAAAGQLGIPIAMVLGQVRGRIFAATNVNRLVASMGGRSITPEAVEELIRNTLGDPTLTLAFPTHEVGVFVDVRGAAVPPPHGNGRTLAPVVIQGRTVAALVHDTGLDVDPGVMEGVAASSLMLLENARLVEELRASRMRLVTVADDERLRLERDLHDGAQQRLMALQIKLALLRDRVDADELVAAVDELEEDASAAVEELRGLAHGIYPTVLRERGLDDGIQSIARASPLPVSRVGTPVGRLSPAVEAAVYFCINEAVQNATKHAGAGAHITISLRLGPDSLEFVIADDGTGFDGASLAGGIGFVSMRDRIGGVGGELDVVSRPGHGTEVRGSVPRS